MFYFEARFKRNSSYEVQVYIPIETTTTKQFSSAVEDLCQGMSLKCILCYDSGTVQPDLPLVVVCQISSRYEPDIDFAMGGIECKYGF